MATRVVLLFFYHTLELFTFSRNSIGERQLQMNDAYTTILSDVPLICVL